MKKRFLLASVISVAVVVCLFASSVALAAPIITAENGVSTSGDGSDPSDADDPTGPVFDIGQDIYYVYEYSIEIPAEDTTDYNYTVTDDFTGLNEIGTLSPGETWSGGTVSGASQALDGQRTYTLTVTLIPDGGTELDAVQVTDDLNYYGIPPTEEIVIDIKPGSDINPINLRSQGVVPVALIDFDPALLEDPASQIIFAGATALRWAVEDVDGDGDLDVICHFKTQELNLDADSTSAGVQIGTSYDEAVDQQVGGYAGEDTVSIVPKGEAKGHAKTSTSSSSTKGNKGGNGKNKNK